MGNLHHWLSLLSMQDDETLAQELGRIDPREDVYSVEVCRHENTKTITQTAHCMSFSQACLRFGNERLFHAWILPSLQGGYEKSQLLCDALHLNRYDWFTRIKDTISQSDHEAFGFSPRNYEFSPLFYWASCAPGAEQLRDYEKVLDDLLALPPYLNRRKFIIDGLDNAFHTALNEQNIIALDLLLDRGWALTPLHVRSCVQGCLPLSLEWVFRRGGPDLIEQLKSSNSFDPNEWTNAFESAASWIAPAAEFFLSDAKEREDFDRLVDTLRVLLHAPTIGAAMLPLLSQKGGGDRWEIECQALCLSATLPDSNIARKPLRI